MVGGGRGSSAHGKGHVKQYTPKPDATRSVKKLEPFELDALKDNTDGNRLEIMKMLDRREQDAEELELESCFSELKQKAGGGTSKAVEEEIESLAGQSLTDLKEMQEMQGLYR